MMGAYLGGGAGGGGDGGGGEGGGRGAEMTTGGGIGGLWTTVVVFKVGIGTVTLVEGSGGGKG